MKVFSNKQDEKKLTIDYENKNVWRKMRSHLQLFGGHIESIRLITSHNDYWENVRRKPKRHDLYYLQLLLQYGVGTLKSMELNWFDFKHYENDAIDKLRSLFSGLSRLVLKNCVNPDRLIRMCGKSTELVLFRTETFNHDLQLCNDYSRLQLDELKTVKIELPKKMGFENLSFITQCENIEYLELICLREIPNNDNEWE